MQKLIVIIGPTASGKSALAVSLARRFNGEVISADSRQVYRGLDIGSGKVTGAWRYASVVPAQAGIQTTKRKNSGFPIGSGMTIRKSRKVFVHKGITHHCIDFVSPRRICTAAEFVRRARRAIADIAQGGHIPIVAGGTAFWIDALVYGFSLPEAAPNARLRRALEKKSPSQLLAILKRYDPRRATEIEQKNPRRLIRAIEIAQALGTTPPLRRRAAYDTLWIGINPSPRTLARRITRRASAMIRHGLIAETKKLLRQRISEKRIREFGFEYAAALDAAHGRISRAALEQRIIRDTKKYTKSQMRWWKRNKDIRWIHNPAKMQAERAVKNSFDLK